ncbi:MAG: type II toxin-antitoxin system HicA family toxin [Chloroflexota bacterium]|nr:type II toxin-antitoxin system HicA family toxin [Chloroflexota bacterium]
MDVRRRIARFRKRTANVRFQELRSLVEAAGWELDRVSGSHHIFVKPGRTPLSIPNHPGALNSWLVDRVLDELERDYEVEG